MGYRADSEASRIHITGLGFAGAAGGGVDALARRLETGESAIQLLPPEWRPVPALQVGALLPPDWSWRDTTGAKALDAEALAAAERLLRGGDAPLRADAAAVLEAKGSAAIAPERLGLVVGGSNLAHALLAQELARFQSNPAHVNPRIGFHGLDTHVAATLAALVQAKGPVLNVAAAAASGAAAAVTALDLLRAGRCDACLVVGAMQRLSQVDWQALAGLGALNVSDVPAWPCTEGGGGFTPGEGAACVLLERADHARQRGATAWAELAGGALVSGADPLPHPCRADEVRAMALALADAGLAPGQVDLVVLHATGTARGDAAELGAVADLFGPGLDRVWATAPKAIAGHGLTSAGVVGLIAAALMLARGRIHPWPTAGVPKLSGLRVATGPANAALHCVITNAFGFGGFNACLALRSLPFHTERTADTP
ncbi:malonyl-ACP decarboxylase [Methylomagnum ishizawai]|uniref:Malonyl-ACP decarboxylase n=1 Tax=Methylomagnum ishizawai TaxID=1760988 RepID=A0A1Y6D403_9GAMM|nr:beta-ketoacyl synthase N-terminal-like domain-containing protein [Methylomagnum ishizawai]SMF97331.1 malonyl-ACP decarboxylase [Methylomagnum ishizawai]